VRTIRPYSPSAAASGVYDGSSLHRAIFGELGRRKTLRDPVVLPDALLLRSRPWPCREGRAVAGGRHRAPSGLPVDAVMRSRARPQRIRGQYDDLLRTAASLKRGWIPASLLITRLKNGSPHSCVGRSWHRHGTAHP